MVWLFFNPGEIFEVATYFTTVVFIFNHVWLAAYIYFSTLSTQYNMYKTMITKLNELYSQELSLIGQVESCL